MQYFPIFLLLLIALILIARPLTVLLHELGHAIPAILLTSQKVTIYIGSYGDPKKSLKINLGILIVFFRYNPFAWRLGLCVPSATDISINKQIIYTLTGPLTSLFAAIIACYFAFTYDLHGFLKLFLIVFLGSAIVDLLINLIPRPTQIPLYDGTLVYNDGYSLKLLLRYKGFPKEYSEGVKLFGKNKFLEAAELFEKLVIAGINEENIYRWTILSYLKGRNYIKAAEFSEQFDQKYKLGSDDLCNMALIYSHMENHQKAIEIYDQSLQLNPNNLYTLNNKGYTLNLIEEFHEAISLFDKAIQLNKDFAYSYNNRGLAKIKIGQTLQGLEDINYSMKLDPNNSYAYRNLGIYHFDKNEYQEALLLFLKAKELDETTHLIDQLIIDTKNLIDKG